MICRQLALFPFLMTWLVVAAPAAEDACQDPSTAPPAQQSFFGGDLKLSRFPIVLGHNLTSNLFNRTNLVPFLIGASGSLIIAPFDQEISAALRDYPPEPRGVEEFLGPIFNASFVGGAFLASRLTKNDHFRSFGYTLAQASVTNGILTQGLKHATHRMRPDGSSSTSFPSGHTSSPFAIATVVTEYYGKKWGIPLYLYGALSGYLRIEDGRHWPSDVIAGAALGYISGRTAILGTKREISRKKSARLMIVPTYGRDFRGVAAYLVF
jgi:membrane-associated phospholipid phosphatase